MEQLPRLGKINYEFFSRVVYPSLGAKDASVIVGPQNGVDFGVVELGPGQVMVLSTDPFYIAKELGIERAAWFAVHIIASDVAVSGIAPKYLSIDLNLPPGITEGELTRLWKAVSDECVKLKIAVVTGHTARYAGCNYPMVGGATMIGIGKRKDLIAPKANPGDAIIITKGPAIEATGLMAAYFPKYLEKKFGKAFVKEAQGIFFKMSTVKDALITAKTGGATAMHDATECGIFGGLYEIATHSQVGLELDLEKIIFPEVVKKTCGCFGLDPYKSISEGTLLATAKMSKANAIISALETEGIEACVAGKIVEKRKGMRVFSDGGKESELKHPGTDPFWAKFEEYLKKNAG